MCVCVHALKAEGFLNVPTIPLRLPHMHSLILLLTLSFLLSLISLIHISLTLPPTVHPSVPHFLSRFVSSCFSHPLCLTMYSNSGQILIISMNRFSYTATHKHHTPARLLIFTYSNSLRLTKLICWKNIREHSGRGGATWCCFSIHFAKILKHQAIIMLCCACKWHYMAKVCAVCLMTEFRLCVSLPHTSWWNFPPC